MLVARARLALWPPDALAIAALAALDGWTTLSAAWSSHPTASLLQEERVLVYAAALLAFVLLAERRASPPFAAAGLAAITVAAGYGLVRHLVAPPPLDEFEGRLPYQPYGYAHALGIVAAIGVPARARARGGRAHRAGECCRPRPPRRPRAWLQRERGAAGERQRPGSPNRLARRARA